MIVEHTCPECGEIFPWVDGKDKRKYSHHLEKHLESGYDATAVKEWAEGRDDITVELH